MTHDFSILNPKSQFSTKTLNPKSLTYPESCGISGTKGEQEGTKEEQEGTQRAPVVGPTLQPQAPIV